MANIDGILPYCAPDLPGCSDPIIVASIRQALIEFCEKTKYWQYSNPAIKTANSVKEYTLSPDTDSQIETILDPITQDSQKIWQRTRQWLDQYYENWQTKTAGVADHYLVTQPGTIRLVPYPNKVTTLDNITLILKPTPTATTIPDVIYNNHFHIIGDYAKALLMEQPGKQWSNADMAIFFRNKFMDKCSAVKSKVKSGFKSEDNISRSKAHFF